MIIAISQELMMRTYLIPEFEIALISFILAHSCITLSHYTSFRGICAHTIVQVYIPSFIHTDIIRGGYLRPQMGMSLHAPRVWLP